MNNPYAKKKKPPPSASASSASGTNKSNGNSSNNNKSSNGPSPVMKNPYARNKKRPRTDNSYNDNQNQGKRRSDFDRNGLFRKAAAPKDDEDELLAGAASLGRASFSQSFSAIEDSHHFQQAMNEGDNSSNNDDQHHNGSRMTRQEQEERAQQRAMDSATANQQRQQQQQQTNAAPSILDEYQNNEKLTDREVQATASASHSHILFISPKQRGNAVLQYIRNVPTQFLRMVPDYLFSNTQCALFLSLKYHSLYPNYIHRRIAELQGDFQLRVLLVLVDVQDNAPSLRQLNSLCVTNRLTLLLAWSAEEAARYLETYKAYQGKDSSSIQKRTSNLYVDQVTDALTACPNINKTDAANLLGQFGSMHALFTKGTPEELTLVAGMGQVKVTRLFEALRKPFSKKRAKQRRKRLLLQQQQEAEGTEPATALGEREGTTKTDGETNEETTLAEKS